MCSNGAGPMIGAIDHYERLDLELAQVSNESLEKMKKQFPPTYVIGKGNPVDVTGGATAEDYKFVIQTFLDDENVHIMMPWFVFQDDPLDEVIVDYLAEASREETPAGGRQRRSIHPKDDQDDRRQGHTRIL